MRATSVSQAAHEVLPAWLEGGDDSGLGSAAERHLERPDDVGLAAPLYARLENHLLRAGARPKLLLTGSRGAGKSQLLARIRESPDIQRRFEVVSASLDDRVNPGRSADPRGILLVLAFWVLRHISRAGYDKQPSFQIDQRLEKVIHDWVERLRPLTLVQRARGPSELIPALGKNLFVLGNALKYDERVSARLGRDPHFAMQNVYGLLADLLGLVERCSGRTPLLVLDDADRFVRAAAARRVFVTHLYTLLSLPGALVLTYPPSLDVDPDFCQLVADRAPRFRCESLAIEGPELERTTEFFRQLLDAAVDLERLGPEPASLKRLAESSFGLPAEFLRLAQRAFAVADAAGLERLNAGAVEQALEERTRELAGLVHSERARQRLARVAQTGRLGESDRDWLRLGLVAFRPGSLEFDVHPLLRRVLAQG